jgi:uncharacterized RDD family membrane protein YckC
VGEQYLRHFRLDRPLAKGGMGEVYLGFDTSLNRQVAIKLIRPELAGQPGFLEAFHREAQAQAQIAHSNVVQVYFIGEANGVWFSAMELVDGGALEGKRLSWKDACRHMTGLAEGLREATRLSIVHRDIKPANVLLDRFGLAHLADFGLATALGAAASGVIMGSPPYMSPEHATGKAVDFRADIYSLGATFYELCSGQLAVRAGSIPEAQQFHQSSRPSPLRALAPEVEPGFARVIDRCLEPEPARRFESYDALISALHEAAPKPIIPARAVQRVLSWAIDLAVFATVTRNAFKLFPLLGFAVLAAWVVAGSLALGATPGQWMMRLHLRTPADAAVSWTRCLSRFALQHGWLAFGVLAVSAAYASQSSAMFAFAGLAAVLAALSLLGSLASLFTPRRQALHDLLSGTMVLMDVR